MYFFVDTRIAELTSIKTRTTRRSNFLSRPLCSSATFRRKRHFWGNVSYTLTIWDGAKSSQKPIYLADGCFQGPAIVRFTPLPVSSLLPFPPWLSFTFSSSLYILRAHTLSLHSHPNSNCIRSGSCVYHLAPNYAMECT